jgi:hypothetical protein
MVIDFAMKNQRRLPEGISFFSLNCKKQNLHFKSGLQVTICNYTPTIYRMQLLIIKKYISLQTNTGRLHLN